MGRRKNIINAVFNLLNGLVLDNGDKLTAFKNFKDPATGVDCLPYVTVTPEPMNIKVGLWGDTEDVTGRIAIFGYCGIKYDEPLFDISEDIIEKIVKLIASIPSAEIFHTAGFSVIEIGPVINEQIDQDGMLAYFSIPLTIVYIED